MWGVFAGQGEGVRMRLRLTPKQADLRGIQYQQVSRTLLNEINDAFTAEKQPPFLPWTVSRIGAFYLPSNLNVDHVRLMVKRHKNGPNYAKFDGSHEYWPAPIGVKNDVCMIEVVEIMLGANAKRGDVTAAVAGTALSGAPIV
jgi:predicted NBD/HSP70 family sugar kinase